MSRGFEDYPTVEVPPPWDDGPEQTDGFEDYDDGRGVLGTILRRSELGSLTTVEPLIDGIISTPAVAVLVGGYGVGKTFLALSMAFSIGTGHRWLGRDVRRTRVLYVLGEGAYGLDKRVSAWESAWRQPVSDDDVTFVVQPKTLNDHVTWTAIGEMCRAGGYGFVVLDTFSSLASESDETKDAARITRWMAELSNTIGGTVLLVHHPGWSDASRTRGGYQLEANPDEVLIATEISKDSGLFMLLRKKVKDGPGGQLVYLRRTATHGSCVIEQSGPEMAGVPMAQRILVVLANYGDLGGSGPQIMTEVDVDDKQRSAFYKALRKLRDSGEIRSTGSGNATRYYLSDGADDS